MLWSYRISMSVCLHVAAVVSLLPLLQLWEHRCEQPINPGCNGQLSPPHYTSLHTHTHTQIGQFVKELFVGRTIVAYCWWSSILKSHNKCFPEVFFSMLRECLRYRNIKNDLISQLRCLLQPATWLVCYNRCYISCKPRYFYMVNQCRLFWQTKTNKHQ